jgi:hypothetical protein
VAQALQELYVADRPKTGWQFDLYSESKQEIQTINTRFKILDSKQLY